MLTQPKADRGGNGGVSVATGTPDPPDDDIQALGDRIAALTLLEAMELSAYLEAAKAKKGRNE